MLNKTLNLTLVKIIYIPKSYYLLNAFADLYFLVLTTLILFLWWKKWKKKLKM
jgi:hypothetical protein